MRLKAIEMQGFKSFPDKTRINFDSGVTAIIGPNGSGKSNISDAIRWVLGEMSAKSLRGSRMEDVIFNGTANRAAANCASVSLVIDTEEEYNRANNMTLENTGSGKSGEESEKEKKEFSLSSMPEITVTRKLYRSGESEYYINKKQVRLKDIYELFYDTGIGREGYSVIGQGRIAEVLSQKDDERRSIFEEAAGISKIRYKKLEAERKLRDTEANLVRVEDILSEISARVGPLEKEAENAKQYLVLSEEKKGIEITLWLDRIDLLRERRAESEEALAEAKTELEAAEMQAAQLDTATDRLLNESYEISRAVAECEREKGEAIQRKTVAEGRRAVCENDITHARAAMEDAISAAEAAKAEKAANDAALAECIGARTAAEEKLSAAGEGCERLEKSYEAARNAYAAAEKELERADGALAVLGSDKNRNETRLAAVNASLEAETRAATENAGRLAAANERIRALEGELERAEKAYDEAVARRGETQTKLVTVDADRALFASRLDRAVEAITAERIAVTGLEQKRDQLSRLESLLEGYSESVKRIVNDVNSGKVLSGGKKVGLYGTVSNIISSDSEYVIALETALAASVQFIVVDKESDAKACIKYLKEHRLGRATFLPLESVSGRKADVSQIEDMPGYVGIASSLAKFDKKFEGVVNDLLGRTVIADNIESASAIARKTGFRVKIVTLDGQIINAGGSYTGGSSAGKVGVFTRAMDIERITEEIRAHNEKIKSLEKEKESCADDADGAESELAALRIALSQCNADTASLSERKELLSARLGDERSAALGIHGGEEALNGLRTELEALEADKQKLIAAVAAAEESRVRLAAAAESAKTAEELEFARVNEARMALYSCRNELSVACERQRNAEARAAELESRIAAGSETLERASATIEQRSGEIAAIAAECDECDAAAAECDKKAAALVSGRQEKESELAEMRARQKTALAAKEDAFRRVTEADMKQTAASNEFDTVTGKLWDEYELTYSDALPLRLPKEKMEKAATRLASLKAKIRSMGVINVNAVEEYRATKERFDFLSAQVGDLNKTRAGLDKTISKLEAGMKESFLECFDKINTEFNSVFCELFGGGSARAELTDPLLPLECGIDIVLKVPGKSVRSISLLSGGEQSFAAVSLYLALQRVNPAPFCVFDEIESALDEVNVVKLASYVRRNSDKTQYILITHRRGTMERADTIYGITMRQKGISEFIRLNMAKLDENIREYTGK